MDLYIFNPPQNLLALIRRTKLLPTFFADSPRITDY